MRYGLLLTGHICPHGNFVGTAERFPIDETHGKTAGAGSKGPDPWPPSSPATERGNREHFFIEEEIKAAEVLQRLDDALERLKEGRHDLANQMTAYFLAPEEKREEMLQKVIRGTFHATKGAEISLKAVLDPL